MCSHVHYELYESSVHRWDSSYKRKNICTHIRGRRWERAGAGGRWRGGYIHTMMRTVSESKSKGKENVQWHVGRSRKGYKGNHKEVKCEREREKQPVEALRSGKLGLISFCGHSLIPRVFWLRGWRATIILYTRYTLLQVQLHPGARRTNRTHWPITKCVSFQLFRRH